MNYTPENIAQLRNNGRLQTYIQSELGVVRSLSLSSVVEHQGVPFGSVLVHLGRFTGQCWVEPYKDGGSVYMRIERGEIQSLPLGNYESPQAALEAAKQQLLAAMDKLRLEALAQATARLELLQAAA